MSGCKLSVLAIVAVISVICAVAVNRIKNTSRKTAAKSVYLIQGMSPATIDRINIKGNDNEVTLKRSGEIFLVTNKDNYPAHAERINELLTGLLDVQSLDIQTSNEQNYKDLGVNEEDADKIIEFMDKDGKTITGLILGNRTENGNSYVRLIDGKDVYLCRNIPYITTAPIDYIEQDLLKIEKTDITEVTITDTNGVSYTLNSDPNSGNITFAGEIPQGKKLGPKHRQAFDALTNLKFNDVMNKNLAPDNLVFDSTYICKLKNSSVYLLKIAKSGDKTYAKFSATFTNQEQITINPTKKESDEQLKKNEEILLGRQAVKKFSEKTKGWVYEIPSYKAENLTIPLSEILEDLKPPKTEKTEE